MNIQDQEERDFHVASDGEWDRAGAAEMGAQDRDRAWILSDRDVWYPNPYYVGPPVRHPEDDGETFGPVEDVGFDDIPF